MKRSHVGIAASLSTLALTLTACGGGTVESASPSGVTLVNDGQLTVCTHLSYRPFQFEQDGEVVGFDVDVVDAIAEELGVEQEIVDTPFETVTTGAAFTQNQCDLSAAAITITPEREEVIAFSDPYFVANQAILTKSANAVTDEAGLGGKRVGAQTGTTGMMYAEENFTDSEIVEYESLPLLLEALNTDQVDAAINDNGVLYDYATENDGFEVGFDIETGENYGIAMSQNNTALLEVTNSVLATIQEDGTYDEIYEEWFNTAPPESSATPTS